jgi:osmotically-inducible protein OsmY
VVTLSGSVSSYFAKTEAERIAKRIRGVSGLANEIRVELPGSAKSTDTELVEKVIAALRLSTVVPSERIEVIIRDGWVTLEGKVRWYYQKQSAEDIVRQVPGIHGIANNITIESDVVPHEVIQKITEALPRNAQLDARHITVLAHNQKVTLSGTVRSWAECWEAEEAAWSAPGVTMVENTIHVAGYH